MNSSLLGPSPESRPAAPMGAEGGRPQGAAGGPRRVCSSGASRGRRGGAAAPLGFGPGPRPACLRGPYTGPRVPPHLPPLRHRNGTSSLRRSRSVCGGPLVAYNSGPRRRSAARGAEPTAGPDADAGVSVERRAERAEIPRPARGGGAGGGARRGALLGAGAGAGAGG